MPRLALVVLLLVCACGDSDRKREDHYSCELPSNAELEPNKEDPATPTPSLASSGPEVTNVEGGMLPFSDWEETRGYWSIEMPKGQCAFLWVATSASLDTSLYFASLSKKGDVISDPQVIAESFVSMAGIAVSNAQILLAYQTRVEDNTQTSTLLLDSAGALSRKDFPQTRQMMGLAVGNDGAFMMILADTSTSRTMFSSALMHEDGVLMEQSEPFASRPRCCSGYEPLELIPLASGYLVGWTTWLGDSEEIRLQRLGAQGGDEGEVRWSLPARTARFQRQLSLARFEDAVAVLWVESDERYEPSAFYDGMFELPGVDDQFNFMLLSAHDLTPRSEVIEIPHDDYVGDPVVYQRDEALWVSARHRTGLAPWGEPISIQCVAQR